jgi:hypothetical protein
MHVVQDALKKKASRVFARAGRNLYKSVNSTSPVGLHLAHNLVVAVETLCTRGMGAHNSPGTQFLSPQW